MLSSAICTRGIVIEFLEERRLILASQKLPLPSTELCYEYSILQSDHCPVVSSVFRWFRSVISHCKPETAPDIMRELIAVFRQYSVQMCMSLREYILTEGIVETCYRHQVQDSELVSQVINLMYECWSSFGSFHFAAILRPNHFRQFFTRPYQKSRSTDFLVYFLEHARRNKLTYDGARMVDVSVYSSIKKSPVFVAADVWCWRPMLKYLQYGANFEHVTVDPSTTRHGVNYALTDTLRGLIQLLCIRVVRPARGLTHPDLVAGYCSKLAPELLDLCRTLSVLLRAVTRLRPDCLDFVIRDHNDQWRVEFTIPRVALRHPVVDFMVPMFNERYEKPVCLQHACRCIIRNSLNENWQLPSGIQHLPLPQKMKRYVNLIID